MQILYFLLIKLVEYLLPLIAFFSKNKKINFFVEGRKNLLSDLELPFHANRFWFHCASLGEFEQARPVIEKLKYGSTDVSIVISFFSPSGFEQKKNYELADSVFYLPLDTPSNARRLIAIIKPKAVVFVKYEIWYYYLKTLFKLNIPVYLISANFRSNQYIFSIWGKWLFNLLPHYKQIFLQNQPAFEILKNKGLSNISISGDTRYDRVIQNSNNVKTNDIILNFKSKDPLLILGSSWEAEENILFQYLEAGKNDENLYAVQYKFIIAPHDISPKHITEIQIKFKDWQPILYTEMNINSKSNILILNTIGNLASAYYYADIAFIGGGFTGQLHNILEPLAFGVPVLCGPVHHKFPEAELAEKEGVLFETTDVASFTKNIQNNEISNLESKARAFVIQQAGASDFVIQAISFSC